MAARMVVYMNISDDSWVELYFAAVPAIFAEYGGVSLAGSRAIRQVEGTGPTPQRMAVLSFPSLAAIDAFMADARYQKFRRLREQGATSEIFVFDNAVTDGGLV